MRCSLGKLSLLGLALLSSLSAPAEEALQPQSRPISPVRRSLTLQSGYIFSGTVKSVERVAPRTHDSVAVMRVTFHVDQGLRGTRTGQMLVIREWAGLWQGGDRYRPGERVMLFLYPPSKLGLTSPVGGASGRFPVDPKGQVIVESGRRGHVQSPSLQPVRMAPREFYRTLRRSEEE